MMAISISRVVSGRSKVMVFEGAYHGGVFLFAHGGSPINAPFDYVMAPFNDIEKTVELVERHADELACVVIEPMQGSGGMIPARKEFLQALRDGTRRHGIILIFDEVVTSRLSGGGLQKILGITPDMTTLGKYIGGGATVGAFGGRDDIMARFDPRSPHAIAHAGTFNNNVITHAAGSTAMTRVYTPEVAESFNAMGDRFRERLNGIIRRHDLPMIVTGLGSIMQLHCCEGPMNDEHDAERDNELKSRLLFHELLARNPEDDMAQFHAALSAHDRRRSRLILPGLRGRPFRTRPSLRHGVADPLAFVGTDPLGSRCLVAVGQQDSRQPDAIAKVRTIRGGPPASTAPFSGVVVSRPEWANAGIAASARSPASRIAFLVVPHRMPLARWSSRT